MARKAKEKPPLRAAVIEAFRSEGPDQARLLNFQQLVEEFGVETDEDQDALLKELGAMGSAKLLNRGDLDRVEVWALRDTDVGKPDDEEGAESA